MRLQILRNLKYYCKITYNFFNNNNYGEKNINKCTN